MPEGRLRPVVETHFAHAWCKDNGIDISNPWKLVNEQRKVYNFAAD